MNLNLAICDDEIKDIELLKKHILQYTIETDNNITVSSYTSAKELISEYNNHSYNVVLLDIEMPDLSGMELAKQLRDIDDDLLIVFTTFYPEYMQTSVYKGYKQDKIEMRGDRAEMSDFPLYLNTVAGGLDRRNQAISGFSFVVKIYAVPVVEIIG